MGQCKYCQERASQRQVAGVGPFCRSHWEGFKQIVKGWERVQLERWAEDLKTLGVIS